MIPKEDITKEDFPSKSYENLRLAKKKKHSRSYNRKRKTSTFKNSHDLKLDKVKICKDFLCMKLKTHKKLINITSNRITCKLYRMSYIVLEILQARLQQYMNQELTGVQAEFRKGRGTRNLSTSTGSQKKQENAKKKKLLLLH